MAMLAKGMHERNKKNKSGFVVLGFIGAGIGAVLGLVTYVNGWL
jgi:tetrahydromethanopterin S-methyltransferase subunit F